MIGHEHVGLVGGQIGSVVHVDTHACKRVTHLDHQRVTSSTQSPVGSRRRIRSPARLPRMVTIARKGIVSKDRKKRTTAWYPRLVDFRKTYYVLPNLFTLSCVLSGFASLALSASGEAETNLYLAALAICFGLFSTPSTAGWPA